MTKPTYANEPLPGYATKPLTGASADLQGSFIAIQRAAIRARQVAQQTGTDLIIVRAGRVVRVSPQQAQSDEPRSDCLRFVQRKQDAKPQRACQLRKLCITPDASCKKPVGAIK